MLLAIEFPDVSLMKFFCLGGKKKVCVSISSVDQTEKVLLELMNASRKWKYMVV